MRQRVCAAIIRDNTILMVQHRDSQREYWTLPGGAIETGETPQQAVVREVLEETGLTATVSRLLFEEEYLQGTATCQCYLVEIDGKQEAQLGYDPEEAHLQTSERLLQGVAWHALDSMKDDGQVSRVIECMSLPR
ncbi:MAG TPA: NUDIX hydrolase [Abditibacteriaceae bacterium]|jgi:8-oxo-dGTP diphosphatase